MKPEALAILKYGLTFILGFACGGVYALLPYIRAYREKYGQWPWAGTWKLLRKEKMTAGAEAEQPR